MISIGVRASVTTALIKLELPLTSVFETIFALVTEVKTTASNHLMLQLSVPTEWNSERLQSSGHFSEYKMQSVSHGNWYTLPNE